MLIYDGICIIHNSVSVLYRWDEACNRVWDNINKLIRHPERHAAETPCSDGRSTFGFVSTLLTDLTQSPVPVLSLSVPDGPNPDFVERARVLSFESMLLDRRFLKMNAKKPDNDRRLVRKRFISRKYPMTFRSARLHESGKMATLQVPEPSFKTHIASNSFSSPRHYLHSTRRLNLQFSTVHETEPKSSSNVFTMNKYYAALWSNKGKQTRLIWTVSSAAQATQTANTALNSFRIIDISYAL